MGPELDPTWLWVLKTTPLYVLIPFGLLIISIVVQIGIGVWAAFHPSDEDACMCACACQTRCNPPSLPVQPPRKRPIRIAGHHRPRRRKP